MDPETPKPKSRALCYLATATLAVLQIMIIAALCRAVLKRSELLEFLRSNNVTRAAAPKPVGITITLHMDPAQERIEAKVEGAGQNMKTDLSAFWLQFTNGVEMVGTNVSNVTVLPENITKVWRDTRKTRQLTL